MSIGSKEKMKKKSLRQRFEDYARNENLSAYTPEEFAQRMLLLVSDVLDPIYEFSRKLQNVPTHGRVGNSVKERRTAYFRAMAGCSIRIGEELEELVLKLTANKGKNDRL